MERIRGWLPWLAIIVVVVAATSIAVLIAAREPEELSCSEWFAEVRDWEKDGGAALFADYPEGESPPKFSEEEIDQLRGRMRELLASEPRGCQ